MEKSRASKARNILYASMQTGMHDLCVLLYCGVNKFRYSRGHESFPKIAIALNLFFIIQIASYKRQ